MNTNTAIKLGGTSVSVHVFEGLISDLFPTVNCSTNVTKAQTNKSQTQGHKPGDCMTQGDSFSHRKVFGPFHKKLKIFWH